jgi:hypothetical protein
MNKVDRKEVAANQNIGDERLEKTESETNQEER